MNFKLVSEYAPQGDQPQAIEQLVRGLNEGAEHQVLLGVTGSGKSLCPEELVLVGIERDGQIEPSLMCIGELVDNAIHSVLPFRTEDHNEIAFAEQLPHHYYAYAIDPVTLQSDWQPITAFTRHPTSASLYHLQTSCGRRVTVTGDHNVWVLREGQLQLLLTTELQVGDSLPLPLSMPAPVQSLQSVSLADALDRQAVYTSVSPEVAATLPLSSDKLWGVIHRSERVRLDLLPPDIAANSMLGSNKRAQFLPATLPLTDEWLRLLGVYIAEGHATAGYITISIREQDWRQDIEQILANANLHYTVRSDGDLQVSSKLLAQALTKWCGRNAWHKRLPPFWLKLSNHQLGALLSAYFTGDGCVEAAGVSCTTVSQQLANELMWALSRWGIWARIRYRALRKPSGEPTSCWTISITGRENLERFAFGIGFDCNRKQQSLDALLQRLGQVTANTNVDVIPISGEQVKSLRKALNWTQRQLAQAMGLCRPLISLIEGNHRRPSRQAWEKLLSVLESSLTQEHPAMPIFQHFQTLANCRWTPIVRIKDVKVTSPFVYDLSVANWETFLAGFGGVFVHNTFTMAKIIEITNRPTLVMAHNKTLAAQLYQEFKTFFPHNAVEYFVSYYDYYQPEAYMPASDTYIEKEATVNEEIDRLRLSATRSLFERRDCIIVASVSCIYGLGDPDAYYGMVAFVERGQQLSRTDLLKKLVEIQYQRNDIEFARGSFRVRGDVVEVYPVYQDRAIRIEFWGDEIEAISTIDPLLGEVLETHERLPIYPKNHYVTPPKTIKRAIKTIKEELDWWEPQLIEQGKVIESQRLHQRTMYDIEMMKELGYCQGVENYSRHLTGRNPGDPPPTLLDYLPRDSVVMVDESHQTIPQVRGMYAGDQSRKGTLVDYGFRLPSAKDNRPLNFDEWQQRVGQLIYVSATPGPYELTKTGGEVAEQVIRPTGLLDPVVDVRPVRGQIDDLLNEIRIRTARQERVLVTTLTKKMSENLTDYYTEVGVRVRYLHSEIQTLERIKILRDLRRGEFDVLVGINLLREGLDLPEVSLVAILDADKEGFLRSASSLIQTMGRAARNVEGRAILYADKMTDSMKKAIGETQRRREKQALYNEEHGITPQTIIKAIDSTLVSIVEADYFKVPLELEDVEGYSLENIDEALQRLEREMREAAAKFEFERAAEARDKIKHLRDRKLTLR